MTYSYSDIDAYLNGELNAEEQQAFEQELRSNQQLQEQVSAYRLLNSTVGKHQQAEQTLPELKKILDPLTHQYFKQQKANSKAKGIIIDTINDARQSAKKINTIRVTKTIPSIRL